MNTVSASTLNSDDFVNIQQNIVSGTVTDASTGAALIGVSVVVKGTTTGAITDINGKFSIQIPAPQALLQVSYIGYNTQEFTVSAGTSLSIAMELAVTEISDVIVVGYGVQKKESVVGAITQVNSETLMKSGNMNITNSIAGRLSGVLTIQSSGRPGANQADIVIRGLSSWNGSYPLILVDGVDRVFADLDPNEISSVSVLKDASATSVFGAKGANGVIIVTTKRGTIGKPELDVSANYGVMRATRLPAHIDSYTTLSNMNVAKMNGKFFEVLMPESVLQEYIHPTSAINAIRYPDVNWYDVCTKPFAPSADANINVHGGTEFIKYFVSGGYSYEGSFFKSQQSEGYSTSFFSNRFNYRANVDFSITKSTQLSMNLGGDISINNSPNDMAWKSLYYTSGSRFPAYFPESALDLIPDTYYPDATGIRLSAALGDHYGNPYTSLNNGGFNRDLSSKMFTDLILTQKMDFLIKGLSVTGKASMSSYYSHRALTSGLSIPDYEIYYEKIGTGENPWFRVGEGNEYWTQSPLSVSVGGLNDGYYSNMYYEMSVNYSNTFGKHSVTALALTNREEKDRGISFPYYNAAFVGRATYDYNRKYLVEVNLGYTGSERFAPGNRYGFFPSVALGWVLSNETFFKNAIRAISKFKIRYSDGLVGSDMAANRWLYISEFKKAGNYIIEDAAPNEFAQWEEAHKRDLGIELGIFKDAFTLSVDLFDEYRSKMLLTPRSVPLWVGNSFKDLNMGILKKHGFEVEAQFRKTTGSGFSYNIMGIFGYNENRIIDKDDPVYAPEYTKNAGKPLGAQLGGVLTTGTEYYTSVDDIHTNVSPLPVSETYVGDYKFLDYTADGRVTNIDKFAVEGNVYPPITFSLGGGFNYKGFDFDMMFYGNIGKWVEFNEGFENEFLFQDWKMATSQLDFWAPNNQDATHSALHYTGAANAMMSWGGGSAQGGYFAYLPGHLWRNASYMRLKQISAGYTLQSNYLKQKLGISNFRIVATGNNIWTITNLIEGDPEAIDFVNGFYPIMMSFKLGVRFSF